jgi:hypothetical protein
LQTGYGSHPASYPPQLQTGYGCHPAYYPPQLQTGSGFHPASYPMEWQVFYPREHTGLGVTLITYFILAPRSRIVELHLYPQYVITVRYLIKQRDYLTFNLDLLFLIMYITIKKVWTRLRILEYFWTYACNYEVH